MGIKEMLQKEWFNIKHLRDLRIDYHPGACIGCWQCFEVCPTGRWSRDLEARIVRFSDPDLCVACSACILQCPEDAIQLILPRR